MLCSVSDSFLNNTIEGVMKMTSHVCFEFSKDLMKCSCWRKKRRSSLTLREKLYMNDSRKPIWMHSGLFHRANSNASRGV